MTTSSFQGGGEHRTEPPLVTMGIIGLCVSVFALQVLLELNLHHYTMCPRSVLHLHEYYRIFTSAVFHANLMHVGMNVMSTAALGAALERRLGSLRFFVTTLWSILFTSIVYLSIACLWSSLTGKDDLMNQHSVGFSGVLFHYVVLECRLLGDGSRSIFGFVQVPAALYPWALLGVLQLILPNLSFVGHLSGVAVGTAHASGLLEGWAMPQAETLQRLENGTRVGHWVSAMNHCVRVADTDPPPWASSSSTPRTVETCGAASTRAVLAGMNGRGLACARRGADSVGALVWGRGRAANANVQVFEWWRRLGSTFGWSSLFSSSRDSTVVTTAHAWSPVPVTDLDAAELGDGESDEEPEHALV